MQRLEFPPPRLLNAGLTTTTPSSRSYFRYFRETLVEMARLPFTVMEGTAYASLTMLARL